MAATGPGAAGMASNHQQLRRDEDLSKVLCLARHLSIVLIFFPPKELAFEFVNCLRRLSVFSLIDFRS